MDYKQVKNPSKPGRPPGGCVYVKDEQGNIVTNSTGAVAYRPATAEDLEKKKSKYSGKKKKRGPKPGSKNQSKSFGEYKVSDLFLKKTYKELTASELERIKETVASMVGAAKKSEKKALQSSIEKLQSKLNKLD